MNLQNEIKKLMKEARFWLLRSGHHAVWMDGETKITTSVSPGCPYVLRNIKADLKRAKRNSEAKAL